MGPSEMLAWLFATLLIDAVAMAAIVVVAWRRSMRHGARPRSTVAH